MGRSDRSPVVLTIAGSDSGGGAGIQADLKTLASLRVHAACAITCVTAQNSQAVYAVQPCPLRLVRAQLQACFSGFPLAAAKTGMLFSAGIVRVVAECLREHRQVPCVVDPVMASTSGSRLMTAGAIEAMKRHLLPRAVVVTPNLGEAEELLGRRIDSVETMRWAAREIRSRFQCAALVKGGHLRGVREAIDVFYDGKIELLLRARFVRGGSLRGTGCTYASAIAGFLALGRNLPSAVEEAKNYVTQAIAQNCLVGGERMLQHFWQKDAGVDGK